MQLKDYLDVEKLDRYVEEGLVTRKYHRTLPLTIYCYSHRAVRENIWNEITTKTRGLIVDAQGTIVARPFQKFFNVGTEDRPETWLSNIPLGVQPEILDKLNGSLGIIWRYGSFSGVASKGSFDSPYAGWATMWYDKNVPGTWPKGYTPIVEMICQSIQRHAVSYDFEDQLILTALINNETGEEAPYMDLEYWAFVNKMKVVERINNKTLGDVLNEDRPGKEGYVISYPLVGQAPLKLKVKHPNFLKLHRIVNFVTPKVILEALKVQDFTTLQDWIDNTPPQVSTYVKNWMTRLNNRFGEILLIDAYKLYIRGMTLTENRSEFASYVISQNKEIAPIAFALLDKKDVKPIIWRLIEKELGDELNKPVVSFNEDNDEGDDSI